LIAAATDFVPRARCEDFFSYNPQPIYPLDKKGFGPRFAADYAITPKHPRFTRAAPSPRCFHLWQDNFVTARFPLRFNRLSRRCLEFPSFSTSITPVSLPEPYTTSGQLLFASGDTSKVPANTPVDLQRFQNDLAALTPGNQFSPGHFRDCSRFSQRLHRDVDSGFDRDFHIFKLSASYVGTAGCIFPRSFPEWIFGASPGFAPFTQFDPSGQVTGGFSALYIMTNSSHSTYHSLQTSVTQNNARIRLSFQRAIRLRIH